MPRPKPMCFSFPFPSGASSVSTTSNALIVRYTLGESAGPSYEQASEKLSWSVIASRKKAPTQKRRGFF